MHVHCIINFKTEENGLSRTQSMQHANGCSNMYRCLLYTSDAADDMQCVDLGGRRIIKKYTTS